MAHGIRLDHDLSCPACGRDFSGDRDLHPGDACPVDDCPSNEGEKFRLPGEEGGDGDWYNDSDMGAR